MAVGAATWHSIERCVMRVVEPLCRWLERRARLTTRIVSELPQRFDRNALYLAQRGGRLSQIGFLCPCRCGAVLRLDLVAPGPPRWRLKLHSDGSVTIFPSIDQRTSCGSHFRIHRSQVIWISHADEPPANRWMRYPLAR